MTEIPNIEQPRFLVDGMLGSLARKLRILGYDTVYDPKSEDDDLRTSAAANDRILLTGDFELFKSAKRFNINTILINSLSERDRLVEVLRETGTIEIHPDQIISRCSQCNGELYDSGKMSRNSTVFSCRTCGKNYWKGSHWNKLNALFKDVNQMLLQERKKNVRRSRLEISESL
jgi:uncharacterized protein with PIN domain